MAERVLFEDDERLDRPDVEALQDLVYEYLQRGPAGAMIGAGPSKHGGLLTKINYSVAGTVVTLLNSFHFAYVGWDDDTPADGNKASTDVVRFDSALSSQQLTVDAAGYLAGEDEAWLWAKRIVVASDKANRRKWDTIGVSETSFSPNTRERERVEFQFSLANPDPSVRWVRVAKIFQWVGGEPTLRGHSFYSDFDIADYEDASDKYVLDTNCGKLDAVGSWGVADILYEFMYRHYRHLTWGDPGKLPFGEAWSDDPANRGINKLDIDLATAEAGLVTTNGLQAGTTKVLWATASIYWSGGIYNIQFDRHVLTAVKTATGRVDVTITAAPAVGGADVMPIMGFAGAGLGTDVPCVVIAKRSTPTLIKVEIYDMAGVDLDANFSVHCYTKGAGDI